MAGADGIGVAEFAADLGPRLEALSRLLTAGRYRAQPVRAVMAVRGGRRRERGVPTVVDRIVQRAFLRVCAPVLESTRAEVSFAYQRGRSWTDALHRAHRYREAGLRWVFRTDIADYFASVDHAMLAEQVAVRLQDRQAEELVAGWVSAPTLTSRGLRARTRGLPEGGPISPALANLHLREFDEVVDGRFGRLVRFADDLALFCADVDAAVAGAHQIGEELARLGLALNPTKSCVTSFESGFRMLGWEFDRVGGRPERERCGWTHPLSARGFGSAR